MVDTAVGPSFALETIERAVLSESDAGAFVGVFEESRRGEYLIDFVALVDIKVASQDNGAVLCELLDFAYHKTGGFTTRHHAYMVHMEVEEAELPSIVIPTLLLEPTPRADANASSIPPQFWLVGCLVQPEMTVVNQFQAVGLEEDSGKFAFLFAVLTPHSDIVVTIESLEHVEQLRVKHLLCAEDIGRLEVDLPAHHWTPPPPRVAAHRIVGIQIANIIRRHVESLGMSGLKRQHYQQQKNPPQSSP